MEPLAFWILIYVCVCVCGGGGGGTGGYFMLLFWIQS